MTNKARHAEFLSHDTKWELDGDLDSILITPKNLDGPVTDPQFELSLSEALVLRKALSYVLGENDDLSNL